MNIWKTLTDYRNHSKHPDSCQGQELLRKYEQSDRWETIDHHDSSKDNSFAVNYSKTFLRKEDGIEVEIDVQSTNSHKQTTYTFSTIGE